jgi:hypothetical protein
VLVYCESKNDNGLVIFDVYSLDDLREWWESRGFSVPWNEEDSRSLIELENVKWVKQKCPREGKWYELPEEFWGNFKYDLKKFNFHSKDRFLLFRISAKYISEQEVDFVQYRVYKEWKI